MNEEQTKRIVRHLEKCLRKKNLALDAMHWVWCDGGCDGGVHRYDLKDLTEEMVIMAERNTQRLRSWYINSEFTKTWSKMTGEERKEWFEQTEEERNKSFDQYLKKA